MSTWRSIRQNGWTLRNFLSWEKMNQLMDFSQAYILQNWVRKNIRMICILTSSGYHYLNLLFQLIAVGMVVAAYVLWQFVRNNCILTPALRMLKRLLCNCCMFICCPFTGCCFYYNETRYENSYDQMRSNYFWSTNFSDWLLYRL